MKEIELSEKELLFLKEEQRYMESKLNILGTVIAATNSLIFIGVNSFLPISSVGNYLGIIITLLLPIGSFLLGIMPWNTFFKKNKTSNDIRFNIFSLKRETWNDKNIEDQLKYQKELCLKIIKKKNLWVFITILVEFIGVTLMLLFLFLF